MFGWEFPPHISGGLGTACHGLTQAMMSQGMEVLFVVPKAYGDEPNHNSEIISADSIAINKMSSTFKDYHDRFQRIEIESELKPYISPEEFERKKKEPFINLSTTSARFNFSGAYTNHLFREIDQYALVAYEIAKKENFDIIHAHDWLTYKAGVAAKEVSGKPLVVHVHATEFDRSGSNINGYVYDIEKEGMERADKVVTVSNYTAGIVHDHYQIPKDKIEIIHNGASLSDVLRSKIEVPKEKQVIFLGRITEQKGPSYFIEAAKKIIDIDDTIKFVMAGSGDMMNEMIQKVKYLGIEDNFHFTGFLKGKEVKEMYAKSKLFVMPSVSEPFGIAPLEAIKQGVPVIISKQSGVSEVIRHAVKVDYWDVDALADAIYGLVNYPEVSHLMTENADQEVNEITWERASDKLGVLYHALV